MHFPENALDDRLHHAACQWNGHLEPAHPAYIRAVALGGQLHATDVVTEREGEFRDAVFETVWGLEAHHLPEDRGSHGPDLQYRSDSVLVAASLLEQLGFTDLPDEGIALLVAKQFPGTFDRCADAYREVDCLHTLFSP